MPVLKIHQYGAEVLRQKARLIETKELKKAKFIQLVKDMLETMYKSNGVGLAAPQVGLSIRLIVIDTDWTEEDTSAKPRVLINPEIIEKSGELESEEGCLSFSGKDGNNAVLLKSIKRYDKVKVKYLNMSSQVKYIEAEGDLLCRCLQHEIDHLDGIVLIDRAGDVQEIKDVLNSSGYEKELKEDK